jgi:hypothetical protein
MEGKGYYNANSKGVITDDTNYKCCSNGKRFKTTKKENNNKKKKFEKDCGFCGKKYQRAKDCHGKKAEEQKSSKSGMILIG